MSEELARWAPGVNLEWALVSLAFGIIVLAIIVGRLWLDVRRERASETARIESSDSAATNSQDAGRGKVNDRD